MSPNPFRNLPSVHELLESPALRSLKDRISHNIVVSTVRTVLEEVGHEVQTAATGRTLPSVGDLAERIARRIVEGEPPGLRPVINATGVLLGDALGRAPLADEAIAEMAAVARDYASVEWNLSSGQPSRRHADVEFLLGELTGAEAAMVVGNNAGATMLALAALAADREGQLPVIHNLGAGAIIDLRPFGVVGQPIIGESIKAGAEVVLTSGDKLLGGPQCGIILGRKTLIEQIERHPMARALRADKLTLAALAATLRLYRDPEKARLSVPLLQLLTTSVENLKNRAQRLASQAAAAAAIRQADALACTTHLDWGTPQELPTWCVALRPATMSVDRLAAALRMAATPVVGRPEGDRLLLDLRSVFPRQDIPMLTAIEELGRREGSTEPSDQL